MVQSKSNEYNGQICSNCLLVFVFNENSNLDFHIWGIKNILSYISIYYSFQSDMEQKRIPYGNKFKFKYPIEYSFSRKTSSP